MKIMLRHFLTMLAAACLIFSSCDKNEEKVIPRSKLSRIYAEMLMTDQWISSTPGVRMIADTSLVYAPILEKYGYTTEDYMRSVDVYMNDPERFSRILRNTSVILDKRLKELRKLKGEIEEARLAAVIKTNFKAEDIFPYLGDEPYVHYYDSISFVPDTLTAMYVLVPIERADTVYDRLRMVILTDSLAVDSLAVDIPEVADTVRTDVVKPDSVEVKRHRLPPPVERPEKEPEILKPKQMVSPVREVNTKL